MVGAVEGVAGAIESAAEAGLQIGKLSQVLGLTTNQVQEWSYVAAQAGVSVQRLAMGVRMFERQLFAVEHGGKNKQFAAALAEVGLSSDQVAKAMQSPDGIYGALGKVSDKFKEMGDTPERAALATQLFGARSAEITAALTDGSEAFEKLIQHYRDLNAELDSDQVSSLKGLHNAINDVRTQITGLFHQAVADASPVIKSLLEEVSAWISAHHDSLKAAIESVVGVAVKIAGGMFHVVEKIVGFFEEHAESIKKFFGKVGEVLEALATLVEDQFDRMFGDSDDIERTIQWLTDVLDVVKDIIEAIDGIDAAVSAIVAPFRDAFYEIADMYNSTLGRLPGMHKMQTREEQAQAAELKRNTEVTQIEQTLDQMNDFGEGDTDQRKTLVNRLKKIDGGAGQGAYYDVKIDARQTNTMHVTGRDAKEAVESAHKEAADQHERQVRQAAAAIGKGAGVDVDVGEPGSD